ncbi:MULTISPECIES: tyrosine-type recombinase/integrase [Rhodobacterales]|uniref:tyrosine-type recombinase/integrase n=1 Tax=Rhodobacterales TaxID=204455 RepID=UPI00058CA3F5|nr:MULTISPECIES: tyrosine-type recombinase/integrase [Rhodobacterales]KII14872.1 integrase [Phaeobacter sp. S60]WGI23099.1 tyrosine-type recombinase/integrase [Amylibacter sp. IMCC11727]
MVIRRKKYLWRHSSGRWYVRKCVNGKMIYLGRITAEEGTADFDHQYWEIVSGKRAEVKTSWTALIAAMRETDKWAGFSPRYRKDLEPVFEYLTEKIGKADVARLTQADIYDAMEKNRHRVRFANYIPTAISMLSKLAIRKRWRRDNPAIDIEPLKVPKARKKPHIPWADWAVEKMREEGKPLPLLIFEIGVGSVQRPGDWVDFQWGDYDGETLKLRQNKTGKPLLLPCTEALKKALDQAKAELGFAPHPSRHILTRADGSAMDYHAMARVMVRERKRLGLMDFDQHALRYRGVMELAWAGCTDDEIASFSGHTSKAMIIKYAGEARQIMRARQAAAKRK